MVENFEIKLGLCCAKHSDGSSSLQPGVVKIHRPGEEGVVALHKGRMIVKTTAGDVGIKVLTVKGELVGAVQTMEGVAENDILGVGGRNFFRKIRGSVQTVEALLQVLDRVGQQLFSSGLVQHA